MVNIRHTMEIHPGWDYCPSQLNFFWNTVKSCWENYFLAHNVHIHTLHLSSDMSTIIWRHWAFSLHVNTPTTATVCIRGPGGSTRSVNSIAMTSGLKQGGKPNSAKSSDTASSVIQFKRKHTHGLASEILGQLDRHNGWCLQHFNPTTVLSKVTFKWGIIWHLSEV